MRQPESGCPAVGTLYVSGLVVVEGGSSAGRQGLIDIGYAAADRTSPHYRLIPTSHDTHDRYFNSLSSALGTVVVCTLTAYSCNMTSFIIRSISVTHEDRRP